MRNAPFPKGTGTPFGLRSRHLERSKSIATPAGDIVAALMRRQAAIQNEETKKLPREFVERMVRLLAGPTPDWSSWVLLVERFGDYRAVPVSGSFFPGVLREVANADRVHVFRADGLLYRSYERVFTYPRTIEFGIEKLERKAVLLMWEALDGKPLRQYRNSPKRVLP